MARIAAVATGGEILASAETAAAVNDATASSPRTLELEGLGAPVDVVTVDWR